MLHQALAAAAELEKEGISAEVVDLRTLLPLDREIILSSVRKTSKALIVHEDKKTGGIGGEIPAMIAEEAFDSLDGPLLRVAAHDSPVPFSPPLEKFYLPNVADIVRAARELQAY